MTRKERVEEAQRKLTAAQRILEVEHPNNNAAIMAAHELAEEAAYHLRAAREGV